MTTESIHRLVEGHAARRGDAAAIVEGSRVLSYRDLNNAANAAARHLIACGFRRGTHATVRLRRGIDLAIMLLAVLKAGGSYTWIDPERERSGERPGVSFPVRHVGNEEQHLHLDVSPAVASRVACSANLPVITRGADTACILQDDRGAAVIVPHATITALQARALPQPTPWLGEPGAFDLWMALMSGMTATVDEHAAAAAAA